MALHLQRDAVYASCFEAGAAGEVMVARAGGACYGCFAAALAAMEPEVDHEPSYDYRETPETAGEVSVPGLGMSVALVANLQAHAALWTLRAQAGEPFPLRGNYFLLASRAMPGLRLGPFGFRQFSVARRRGCLACSAESRTEALALQGRTLLDAAVCDGGGDGI